MISITEPSAPESAARATNAPAPAATNGAEPEPVSYPRVRGWIAKALKKSPASNAQLVERVQQYAKDDDEKVRDRAFRAARDDMARDGEIYRDQAGPHESPLWYFGPRPAPEPVAALAPADDAGAEPPKVPHPFAEEWTRAEDLIEHAREQLNAADVNPRINFKHRKWITAAGAENFDAAVDYLSDAALRDMAIKQSIVRTLTGDVFLALPYPRDPATGEKKVGRYYVRAKNLDAVDQLLKFAPDTGWAPDGKSPAQIDNERSIIATGGLTLDGMINTSFIDRDRRFRFRCWELSPDVEPERSDIIEEWFDSWGAEQKEKLYDYVATFRMLDRAAPIAVLKGTHSLGKGMLGKAFARLFRVDGAPVDVVEAAASFNAELEHSPIIVADEKLPETWNGAPFDLERLKKLIDENHRTINQKNVAKVQQRGYTRWLFGTNLKNPFPTVTALDRDSLDAFLQRALYIEPEVDKTGKSAPAAWLEKEGGFEFTRDWVEDQQGRPGPLTRHLRAIVDEHVIKHPDPMGRFACAPDAGRLADIMRASTRIASLTIAGVTAFLAGERGKQSLKTAIQPSGGRVLVQLAALHGEWSVLTSGTAEREARRVAPTLAAFAHEIGESVCLPGDVAVDGDPRAWRAVRLDLLLDHAATVGLSVDAIKSKIGGAS